MAKATAALLKPRRSIKRWNHKLKESVAGEKGTYGARQDDFVVHRVHSFVYSLNKQNQIVCVKQKIDIEERQIIKTRKYSDRIFKTTRSGEDIHFLTGDKELAAAIQEVQESGSAGQIIFYHRLLSSHFWR